MDVCVCGHTVGQHAGGGGRCSVCFCEAPTLIGYGGAVLGPVTLEEYRGEAKS